MRMRQGWETATLAEVGLWGSGGTPKASEASYYGGEIPWVRSGDLPDGPLLTHELTITQSGLQNSAAKWIEPGSVLVAMYGATIGRAAITTYPVTTNQAVASLTPLGGISSQFLFGYFRNIKSTLLGLAQGGAQPNISQQILKCQNIQLPPIAEQRRIVIKLDALTARIARARAELVRVHTLVRHLKRQALSICFSTEAGYPLIFLGNILGGVQAGKNLRCEERPPHPGELGVVKVSAVTWGRFDPTKAKTLPPDYIPPEAARITTGDLLMSRANTIELVGAVALVEQTPRDLFLSDKVLRLVVPEDAKRWVQWFLRSPTGREQIERMATGNQLSMRNLSQDALRRIVLPFPDAATRLSIVYKLEAAFARADSLQSEAARATKLLDRLEQSILVKAFRGALVPQDPADEPASVLLDRIRAERATVPKAKRSRPAAPAVSD